jgi:hypothetical protein
MTEILLSSESFIKSVSSISDNVAGKYILPSLREAQEIGLRGILGDCLLDALKERKAAGQLVDQYLELVQRCQYYLAYATIVEVAQKVTYKVGNFGVTKSTDENLQVASQVEVSDMRFYYQAKADACCRGIQRWLLNNRAAFPELRDCDCAAIRANLYSAASCGIWLGGPRGRERRRGR